MLEPIDVDLLVTTPAQDYLFGLPKFVLSLHELNVLGVEFGAMFMVASILLWRIRGGVLSGVVVGFLSLVVSCWLVTKTGLGIAGAIGFLFSLFLGVIGLFLAAFSGWVPFLPRDRRGAFVTIALAAVSFALPAYFSAIDENCTSNQRIPGVQISC